MILNERKLEEIVENKKEFYKTKPYPHINPQGLINEKYFKLLRDNDPYIESKSEFRGIRDNEREFIFDFKASERKQKLNGVYFPDIWMEFLDELDSNIYKDFISNLLDVPQNKYYLLFSWSYRHKHSHNIHPDSEKKLATHLFYFLDETNWDESYGGQTSIFKKRIIPKKPDDKIIKNLEDFKDERAFLGMSKKELYFYQFVKNPIIMGNRSLLFKRSMKSFHGVFPYDTTLNGGAIRKVFFPVVFKN